MREKLIEEIAKTLYAKYLEHYHNIRPTKWDDAQESERKLLRIQAEAILTRLDELGFDLKV